MRKIKSCGFLIFSRHPRKFLLLKHPHRYDFPKGHIEEGESDLQCALRELYEETGVDEKEITIDHFSYEVNYITRYKRFGNKKVSKTVKIFLGWLESNKDICVSEHQNFAWFPWPNVHSFKEKSIAEVLHNVKHYFEQADI